jgi:hypothetical protein
LAGALLLDEKIHQSAALFWFGLRIFGLLYSRAVTQRTIYVFIYVNSGKNKDAVEGKGLTLEKIKMLWKGKG